MHPAVQGGDAGVGNRIYVRYVWNVACLGFVTNILQQFMKHFVAQTKTGTATKVFIYPRSKIVQMAIGLFDSVVLDQSPNHFGEIVFRNASRRRNPAVILKLLA